MRHGLRITVLLLVAGLVLLAAGCGGGKKTAAPTTSPSVGATGYGHKGTTDVGGPTGAGPTGSGGFASAKNCLAFASLAAKIASAMSPTAGGASSLENGSRTLQAIADAAPSDIKGDLQTIASAFSGYVQKVQDAGYDPSSGKEPTAAQMAALVTAAKVFDTAKFKQASQHLDAWEARNCK